LVWVLYISGCFIVIYAIAFLVVSWGFHKQLKHNKLIGCESKLSVVIAVRNEEENIEKCINSLLLQDYAINDFEIIVVDDHSSDKTVEIVEIFCKKNNNIRLLKLVDKYAKKEAIKLGVESAKYTIIATTDADCLLPLNWLNIISSQLESKASMLLGPIKFKEQKGFLNAFQQLDLFAMQGLTFGLLNYQKPIINNGANLSFLKEDFLNSFSKINQKNPSGDDVFLLEQLKLKSKNIVGFLHQKFIVETNPEETLLGFFNQRIRWASKSKYYRDNWLMFFSFLVLSINLLTIFIYFHLVLIDENRGVYIILLLTKWLIDFILLFLVSSFFDKRRKMIYFLLVQLVYPFYIFFVGFMSFFMKFNWKGRVYNG
jgi:biofilm PGA synthesis N-glycosyltransferase PgaC